MISWEIYSTIVTVWMGIGILTFFFLFRVTAPYGRHTASNWGPMVDNRLGWVMMELPVMIVLLYFVIPEWNHISWPACIMITLFLFHYVNRTFVFPLRLKTKGKKMPVVIVLSAILFNLVNGFSLGYYFASYENYSMSWLTGLPFITGTLIFFTGIFINWKSDTMLISLRKPDETHYVIPKGWLFDHISCPNLFGELVEWLGFAILCWNLPALSFFVWTAANLVPRAISHHTWYQQKFPEYPEQRKAVIPFIR